jgi:tRNA(Ile)-lysidine synthase TilS/MesJ
MRALEKGLDKLHKYIVDKSLFASGSKLLLAVSGGSDSVGLLCLFARLRSGCRSRCSAVM